MARFQKAIADAVADSESRGLGAEFWLSTTVVPGNITTQGTPLRITQKSTGELLLQDVILRTDGATGLAGLASFVVQIEGSRGTTTVMVAGLGDLGASATIDLMTARLKEEDGISVDRKNAFGTISQIRANGQRVMQEGQRVQTRLTGAAATGIGSVDVYLKFRRMAGGADAIVA